MSEIVKLPQKAQMPPAANPAVTRAIDIALSGAVIQGGQTVLLPGKEIEVAARRAAEGRLSILSRSLDARDRTEVSAIILRLLTGFPSVRQSGNDAMALLAAYVSMVDEYPPWAVAEACRRWVDTSATPAFPPSAAELREACQRVVYRYNQERGKLMQALTARTQPAPPGEHERVSAGLDLLRAEIDASVNAGKKRPTTAAEARASLERTCAELGIDPQAIDETPNQPDSFRRLSATVPPDLRGHPRNG